MAGRGQMFLWLTGRTDVDVDGGGDLRGMLLAAGGPSNRTKSGIDLTAAASKLGVSRRTVERWHRSAATGQGQRPSPAHMKSLTKAARRAATTKAGRAQWVSAARADQRYTNGARLVVDAYQGPGDSEGEHMRDRAVTHMLDRDQLEAMWSAYEQGGDKGMQAWLSGTGESYLDGWRTGEIYDISVIGEDDYRRGRR
jgi:transcriptional regulator with XRE-family HTH domain